MTLRWNQRGVAYWGDGADERIYWGTGDGYLIAVDAKTGRPVPGFGDNGRVDLMEGLPRAKRGSRDYLNALTYSVQSPPIVVARRHHRAGLDLVADLARRNRSPGSSAATTSAPARSAGPSTPCRDPASPATTRGRTTPGSTPARSRCGR